MRLPRAPRDPSQDSSWSQHLTCIRCWAQDKPIGPKRPKNGPRWPPKWLQMVQEMYKNLVKINTERLSWKMRFVLFFAIDLVIKPTQELLKTHPKTDQEPPKSRQDLPGAAQEPPKSRPEPPRWCKNGSKPCKKSTRNACGGKCVSNYFLN